MKKKTIQLVVLLVLLAGAVAAVLLLRPGDDDVALVEESVDETIYLLGGEVQRFAKSIEVKNDQDTYTIVNGFESELQPLDTTGSAHTVQGIDLDFLNQTTLRSAFSSVGSLPVKKTVAESGADFALYGLDNPSATVEIAYADGTSTLLVGDNSPGGEGIYASVDGGVYLVDSGKVSLFRESRYHYITRTITEGNSESTIPTKAVLSGGQFPEPVTVERMPDDEIASMTGFSTYRISAPIVSGADSQRGVQPLQTVFGLSATEVLADTGSDAGALARYGLDTPYMTVEMQAEEITPFTLAIAYADDEEGGVYVKSSTSPFVYRVLADSLPFLEMTLFDMQEKMIILPNIDTVSEVEVAAGDRTYLFELRELVTGEGEDEKSELIVHLDGRQLDTDYFRKFYQTLIVASYDSEIEPDEPAAADDEGAGEPETPVDTPLPGDLDAETGESPGGEDAGEAEDRQDDAVLRYTYRYRDGSPDDVVLFEPGPARKVIVSLNGGRPYYARSVYVDRVLEDLPKIASNQEVTAYL